MKNIIAIVLILIIPVFAYLIVSRNSENLNAIAKENDNPTVISFTSSMCMDCQKMKGVLNELQAEYKEKINFNSINAIDKNKKVQESIKTYGVVLVPTLILVDKNGNQIEKIEGFIPKEELVNKLENLING